MVYGGGGVGLMGKLADAVLAAGGEITGVIPRALVDREIGHRGVADLRVVDSMHERKALMADLADAFVALPGGVGTLEELIEVFTWSQLGLHRKPCALLDVESYYEGLTAFLDHAVRGALPDSGTPRDADRRERAGRACSSACAPSSPARWRRSGSTARRRDDRPVYTRAR